VTIKTRKEEKLWHQEKKVLAMEEARSFPVAEEEWVAAVVSAQEGSAFVPIVEKKSPTSAGRRALKSIVRNAAPR